MRDIRNDLKERLESLARQREQLQAQLSEVDQTESGVKSLLRQEEQRYGALVLTSPDEDHANGNGFGRTPLSQLILETFKQKTDRPLMLSDFKKQAERVGFDFGEKSPGRTLHWALVGLAENGHITVAGRGEDRRYSLKEVTQ